MAASAPGASRCRRAFGWRCSTTPASAATVAGIAGLDLLQAQGIAACTVSHDSARIGESASTFDDGVISHANAAAAAMGAAAGQRLRDWLATLAAG